MDATQTKKILREMPNDQSIMLVAKHGVGKSSVVKQVTEDLDIGFFDVRLSQCEVGDIKGLPYLDEENSQTKFFKPQWWPKDPASKGVLFFDELNRASKDVLQAVFEICLDRRLDGEALPDGWRVVAARPRRSG
jgi:MoxR-like ATPase